MHTSSSSMTDSQSQFAFQSILWTGFGRILWERVRSQALLPYLVLTNERTMTHMPHFHFWYPSLPTPHKQHDTIETKLKMRAWHHLQLPPVSCLSISFFRPLLPHEYIRIESFMFLYFRAYYILDEIFIGGFQQESRYGGWCFFGGMACFNSFLMSIAPLQLQNRDEFMPRAGPYFLTNLNRKQKQT
jgi:hypothetical protein